MYSDVLISYLYEQLSQLCYIVPSTALFDFSQCFHIMVILRSGSVTKDSSNMSGENVSLEHFILCLTSALNSPDIRDLLKQITQPSREEFGDLISSELHRQLKPTRDALSAKDAEIADLKKTIADMNSQLEELEQHGRRDSLRIAGIPESDNDDTDSAILNICSAIEVDPPVQPSDIAVSHRLGKKETGKTRQVIVKFATRNVRERVYSSKKNIKSVKEKPEYTDMSHIYINEDLTKFRANLAREARSLRNSGQINDTWTMYGKIMVKDKHNRIKIVKNSSELQALV